MLVLEDTSIYFLQAEKQLLLLSTQLFLRLRLFFVFLTNLTEINLSKNLFSSSAHHEAHYKNPSYIGYLNQTREKKQTTPSKVYYVK